MEIVPLYSLCTKLLGDSYKRRGLSPNKSQSLYIMLPDRSTHIVLIAELENERLES